MPKRNSPPSKDSTSQDFLSTGLRTIRMEREALELLERSLDAQNFSQACLLMLECQGRVVVSGMGKSGHIARKIAATLSSTGTPSFYMHPGEAGHGDFGMVTKQDVVLALSHSGNTRELLELLPLLERMAIPLIAITGQANSPLGKSAHTLLCISLTSEACPMNLAPTSSTTAALALGDALAISLLEARGFTATDFAFSHPAGTLGKNLLLKVSDVMRSDSQIPKVTTDTPLKKALLEISKKKLGLTTVVDERDHLVGVFTDGDLRRLLDTNADIYTTQLVDVMTRQCITIDKDSLAAKALALTEKHHIGAVVVIDQHKQPIGVISLHDLLAHGLL